VAIAPRLTSSASSGDEGQCWNARRGLDIKAALIEAPAGGRRPCLRVVTQMVEGIRPAVVVSRGRFARVIHIGLSSSGGRREISGQWPLRRLCASRFSSGALEDRYLPASGCPHYQF